MGILDDLKKWAHPYEDEDEEYEDDFPDLRDRGDTGAFADRRSAERKAEDRRNKVVNINASLYENKLDILSMGMSGEYEDAVRCGATMVRVGTAIFGARHYTL